GHATHIARISRDTIVVVTGSTYSFTVDTPEDKGLVSTRTGVQQLLGQIRSRDLSVQKYSVVNKNGISKKEGELLTGDQLVVTSQDGKASKKYYIAVRPLALSGQLRLEQKEITVYTKKDLTLYFTAGQRSPDATVKIYLPLGIHVSMDNTTVNVIGRGDVKLKDLARQSIGRVGTKYSYSKVGEVSITKSASGTLLTFSHLDLRPANGADLKIVISNVKLANVGAYTFKAIYTTSQPEVLTSAGTGAETATLTAIRTLSDFERVIDKGLQYKETPATYSSVRFKWTATGVSGIQLMQSLDKGKSWSPSAATIDVKKGTAMVAGLEPNQLYTFRLSVKTGENKGLSNPVHFYSGKMDIKNFGVSGEDKVDNTEAINKAIDSINKLGGGTLLFSKGVYSVRTIYLKSNVFLYIEKGATIKALKGADAPESTWFSDKKYRSGL
ncbi:MAG TPA: endopygalactorunase, partial [Flavisolibacter sp.]|nr:endopygalactorunase [Flavisolibacter sp.]